MMNQEAAMICDDKVLEKSHASRVRKFIYFTAGMAGLLFGLDQGVIAGALPFITAEWGLNSAAQERVVSCMMVGAAIGALCAAFMTARIGRKRSLLTGAALFIVGSVGSGLALTLTCSSVFA